MVTVLSIPVSMLQLDPINPRLDDGTQTQREALSAMMVAQGGKLVSLARDIAKLGLSPLDRFLVLKTDESADYLVLEGNRRLTAIKLLLNPDLAQGSLGNSEIATLRELSSALSIESDWKVECVVVETREAASHWLQLRHGGELDGVGTVRWGATEGERFRARAGVGSPELKVLEFVVSAGGIEERERDAVSITNLRRLLNDSHVRETLGIQIDRKAGTVTTRFPTNEVAKSLTRIVKDLADDDFKVGKIYTKTHRKQYMREIAKADRPNPKTILPSARALGVNPAVESGATISQRGGRGGRVSRRRSTVAPTTLALRIDQSRLKDIYRELQQLEVERFANAGAVLLRVFLELTVDRYVKKHKTALKPHADLADRLQAVHDHLSSSGVMTRSELSPIRKAISSSALIAPSVSLFNLYVHELHLTPSPQDVRVGWDSLELFFQRIWA